jgi:hypothetical protein
MLLYGMDGDPSWDNRHTRFLAEVYAGDELEVEYILPQIRKKEERILKRMAYYQLMFKLNKR